MGDKSIIEQIGSVATIIVEKYEQLNLLDKMNKDIAKLLMSAILDNTLNFTANITNNRDRIAYHKLEEIVKDYNYAEKYFREVQESIEKDLEESIKNDIKIGHISEYIPDVFGQLTIWDSEKLLMNLELLKNILNSYNPKWIMNLISLKDNTSYIICSDNDVKMKIERFLNCSSYGEILVVKPAMLRKEIMKKVINK